MTPDELKRYRAEQGNAYRDRFSGCEVTDVLRKWCDDFRWFDDTWDSFYKHEIHHITGRSSNIAAKESWSNLIAVSMCAHHWCHNASGLGYKARDAFDAAAIISKIKMHKTETDTTEPKERWHFSLSCWNEIRAHCVGPKTFEDYVESLRFRLAQTKMSELARELVSAVKEVTT